MRLKAKLLVSRPRNLSVLASASFSVVKCQSNWRRPPSAYGRISPTSGDGESWPLRRDHHSLEGGLMRAAETSPKASAMFPAGNRSWAIPCM